MGDLSAQFEAAVADWRADLTVNEWFFATLRERLTGQLAPADAFESLGGVAALVLRQADGFLCSEAAQLLLDLAWRSGTTEVPPALDSMWGRLMSHLDEAGRYTARQAKDLALWYRREVAAEPARAPDCGGGES